MTSDDTMPTTGPITGSGADPACALAHGDQPGPPGTGPQEQRTVVAVFDSPVAAFLLHFARDCGFATALLEPRGADAVTHAGEYGDDLLTAVDADGFDGTADVVVTDHHRPELGEVVRDLLAVRTRWIGVMGNPRHAAPHVQALQGLGVPDDEIARVHRPIGLNIGSRTPGEIAVATLAGLIADRRERPGGFHFG